MKPIVGVFDEGQDFGPAIEALDKAGFGEDEISVVDQQGAAPEETEVTDATLVGNTGMSSGSYGPMIAYAPLINRNEFDPPGSEAELYDALEEIDVPREDIEFYVDAIKHGAQLVIVRLSDEEAADSQRRASAENILKSYAGRVVA